MTSAFFSASVRLPDQRAALPWLSRTSRRPLALITMVLVLLWVVVTATPASAHATLEQATPAQGSRVSTPPSSVILTFSERVGFSDQSIEVLDSKNHRVDKGNPHHPAGQRTKLTVDLMAGLPDASYVVRWRVASSDSHPIKGTFSFGVRVDAGAPPANVGGSHLVGALDWFFHGVAYAGVVLLLGGTAFLAWLWPGGLTLRRPRRLVTAGWLASVIGATGLFLLQGPYGASLGVADLVNPALADETLNSRYGHLMVLRLVCLAASVPALRMLATARRDLRVPRTAVAVLGVVVLFTFSLSEHAGQGDLVPLWAGVDALHLAAASAWVGGLAVLAYAMLGRSTAADLADVLPRWSRVAMVAVATIVVTGTAQAWRETGSLSALTGTEYGLLVLGKVAGLTALLVLGNGSRRWVNRHARWMTSPEVVLPPAGEISTNHSPSMGTHAASMLAVKAPRIQPGEPPVGQLRTSVTAEVGIAVVVLGLTAVLVNTVPANLAYGPPYTATVVGRGNNGQNIMVRLDIDRTKVGPTTMRIYTYTKAGALPFVMVDGTVTEHGMDMGPVKFSFPAGARPGPSWSPLPAPGP